MKLKIISKVKNFIVRKNSNNSDSIKTDRYISMGESSFLLNGKNLRFDNNIDQRLYVEIGERCLIGATFIFESSKGHVKIGNNVHIGGAIFISRNSIEVEDDVTMAWGITLYDHDSHSVFWEHRKNDNTQCYEDYLNHNGNNVVNKDWNNVIDKPIYICSKVWIGFDVTVLKGITIGEGAVIGAKSVVTKDVPPWTIVAGNPARVVKQLRPTN